MSVKNKVVVKIAGKDYTLVGDESDEYMQKIALFVDKKMTEIMKNNNKLSTMMAAILTALNIADEYYKREEREIKLKNELNKAIDELEKYKSMNDELKSENTKLKKENSELQIELVKREAELNEVRNALEKHMKSNEI